MNTIYVNLFGGPGTGKSTLCSLIFSDLKIRGIEVEMVLEYAKDLVWEENYKKLSNQIYVFARQHHGLYRLNGKVNVVITDSPLINSIVYDRTNNKNLHTLIISEFNKMETLNYYIQRHFEYNCNGRYQDECEAKLVDIEYKKVLDENSIDYKSIIPGMQNVSIIVEEILKKIRNVKNI